MSRSTWRVSLLLTVILGSSGCQSAAERLTNAPREAPTALSAPTTSTPSPTLSEQQILDVQLSAAKLLERQTGLDAAESAYRRILEVHPDDPSAMHRLAVVLAKRGRTRESGELFRRALKSRPDDPDILCDYGYSLFRQRDWKTAESLYRQAIAAKGDHRRAQNHLGVLLAHRGLANESVEAFERAGCDRAEAFLNLAAVCEAANRPAEAQAACESAMAAAPRAETQIRAERLHRRVSAMDRPELAQHGSGDRRPADDLSPQEVIIPVSDETNEPASVPPGHVRLDPELY